MGCEEFNEQVSSGHNFECSSPKENVIVLTGTWQSNDDVFQVEKSLFQTVYKYNAIEYFDIMNQFTPEDEEDLTSESLSEMKMINPDLKYIINMPGTIESSSVGSINENKVTIDVFDLENLDSVMIVSVEKNNTLYYIIAGGIGLFLVLIIFLVLFLKKRKSKKTNVSTNNVDNSNLVQNNQNLTLNNNNNNNNNNINNNISQQNQSNSSSSQSNIDPLELKSKNYILQYKAQYSRESIKQVLVKSGIDIQKVEEYLNKYF